MSKLVAMIIAGGLLAMTFQLSAQPGKGPPPRGGPPGGGRAVTPEELVARVFAADENQDGKLSKEELSDPRLARLFARADADSDGFVTKVELTSQFTKEVAGAPRSNPDAELRGPREPAPPGGRGGPPGEGGPRIGQVIPRFVQESLDLSDDQKTQLEALQKEVDARLDKILTPNQKRQLREMRDRGPGGAGGTGARPERGPGVRPPQ